MAINLPRTYVEAFRDVGCCTRYRLNKVAVYDYLRNGVTLIYNLINNKPWVDVIVKQVVPFARVQTAVSGHSVYERRCGIFNHGGFISLLYTEVF